MRPLLTLLQIILILPCIMLCTLPTKTIQTNESPPEPTTNHQTIPASETITSDVHMTDASEAQTVSSNHSLVSEVNIASDKPSSSIVLSDQIAPPPIITDPDFQSMCDTIYADIRELHEARRHIYHVPSYAEKWDILQKQFAEALEK